MTRNLNCIILAAGHGTRMRSHSPKVMHTLAGRPMLDHVIDTARALSPDRIVTVLGPEMADRDLGGDVQTAIQQERRGTGHAVQCGLEALDTTGSDCLILYGDVPLITTATLQTLITTYREGGHAAALLGMTPPTPTGYGRIIRDADDTIISIVEDADADEATRATFLCNGGIIIANGDHLPGWLEGLGNDNAKGEYYLTDIIARLHDSGHSCGYAVADYRELQGVNDKAQLADAEAVVQDRLRQKAMANGVTLRDPGTIYFSYDTKLAVDVVVEPGVIFAPGVRIGKGSHIKGYSRLENCEIGRNCEIGPFAHIADTKKSSTIADNVALGNFVEVKRARLEEGVKAKHLAYIADAHIGAHTNFGCGAITVNYDGKDKHKTTIGEHVMVGCNVNLVAPVEVGDHAYLAAGSTINVDIPVRALSIARSTVTVKEERITPDTGQKEG
jgi:bifunctional UDP-N-acetylglucosamine pyrophosphorylase/glucosamine-1-phosphate N-acetyltransferase